MMQIAYYDGGNHEKQKKVEEVLSTFPYQFCLLEETDLNKTIGSLMKVESDTRMNDATTYKSATELMILQNLQDEEIQEISMRLREADAHVACKAMVTKHNKDWILHDLLTEIAEEHAYFIQYDKLKKLILEMSTLQETDYSKINWAAYQRAIMDGYILLQEKQPAKSLIEQAIQTIEFTKSALSKT